jgi:hypothetical protein
MGKKLLLSFTFIVLSASLVNAQLFNSKEKYLNAGFGLGSAYYYGASTSTIPPIHASFEVGVTDKIGVGGLIGYTASRLRQSYFLDGSYTWKFSYLVLGARGAYHFLSDDKADVYAGLMLGYNIAYSKFETNDPEIRDLYKDGIINNVSVGGLAFGAFVGGRYMFSENVGGFAELGYNISWLSLGATFRL